jgi:predicted N-acetyltransferase YhbS
MEEAGPRYGWATSGERDEASRVRSERRVAHLQRTGPDGCWVAESGGAVVGAALALRRGPLWFLSALSVTPPLQGRGIGRALLDAALRTAAGAPAGMIMSSSDPKALRRYGRAGFALLPGFDLTGTPDRSALPAVEGVREGDWSRDAPLVDGLGRRLRGAAYGPDLEVLAVTHRLLVADDGFVAFRGAAVSLLGAGTPAAAQALLWAALAEGDGAPVRVDAVTGAQQWAVEVALAAGLQVRPGTALCTRGAVGPLTPYLPSGGYG